MPRADGGRTTALTTDGLNLDTLPQKMKGVTCYFCHAADSVTGTHNNPLTLATDDSLFGPFADPAAGTPHKGVYSRLLDGATLESASMCGSCHDIVRTCRARTSSAPSRSGRARCSRRRPTARVAPAAT